MNGPIKFAKAGTSAFLEVLIDSSSADSPEFLAIVKR